MCNWLLEVSIYATLPGIEFVVKYAMRFLLVYANETKTCPNTTILNFIRMLRANIKHNTTHDCLDLLGKVIYIGAQKSIDNILSNNPDRRHV